MKKCPYCAEEIQDEAIICRYCGRDLAPKSIPTYVATPADSLKIKKVTARTQAVAGHQMDYIDQSLTPGEQIMLRAKLNWAMFVAPVVFALLGLIFLVVISARYGFAPIACIAALVLLAGLASLLQAVITYTTTEFAVTDKRIIAKAGFLRHRSLELMLTKVESIVVNQSIMGRIFNYGVIVVIGTGGTKESFPNIAAPMEFRRRVNAQIAGAK